MKQYSGKLKLVLGISMMVLATISAVVGIAQLVSAVDGDAWDPVLVVACAFAAYILPHSATVLTRRTDQEPSVTRRFPAWARRPLDVVLWTAWWAAVGVLISAVLDRVRGTVTPSWPNAVRGALLGIGTLFMMTAFQRGWIRGVFVRPDSSTKERRSELARRREEILTRARQRSTN